MGAVERRSAESRELEDPRIHEGSAVSRSLVPATWLVLLTLGYIARRFAIGWLDFLVFDGVLTVVFCMALEAVFPYREDWGYAFRNDWRNGARHLATDLIFFVPIRAFVLASMFALTPFIHAPFEALGRQLGVSHVLAAAPVGVRLVVRMLVVELVNYWFHRAIHKYPLLWRLHFTHHQSEVLNAAKTGRTHPFELILIYALSTASGAMLGGSADENAWFALVFTTANTLAHSNIATRTPRIYGAIFTTPEMHRVHHSAEVEDLSNFACVLSFMDVVFGTYRRRESSAPLVVGVKPLRGRTLREQLLDPLSKPVDEL